MEGGLQVRVKGRLVVNNTEILSCVHFFAIMVSKRRRLCVSSFADDSKKLYAAYAAI